MAVLQTQKISICALKSSRKQILEELQRTGVVQVEESGEEDEVFRRTDTAQARSQFERDARNAESALKVLDTYAPEKKGMLSSLEGKEIITADEYYENSSRYEQIHQCVSRILSLDRKISEDQAAKARDEAAIESLAPWMSLDIPINEKGTADTTVIVGSLPGEFTAADLTGIIAAAQPELDDYELEVLGADATQTCVFAVVLNKDAQALEEVLRVNGFVRPNFSTNLTPAGYADNLKEDITDLDADIGCAADEIRSLASERENIRFVADYQRMRADKYEVLGGLLQSDHVFFLSGFVPAYVAQSLKEKLEKEYICDVEISDVPEDEDAPVLLHNNAFAAPTETVLESYGLPHKGEIDPTAIMAVFYYIFFGMMLSDAGYGLVLMIGTALILWRFRNMSPTMTKMMKMFFWCGVSTTVWGILFGGYFGDAITTIAATFFHKDIVIPAVWFTPLDNPMRLLIWCFAFGLIHLFVGLGLKAYMDIRDRKFMSFFANEVCWYAMLISLIIILVQSSMWASMAGSAMSFPPVVTTICTVVAIVSAVCIVVFSESGTKNPAARFGMGAYDLYGITSWLSDVLSYSRLLALGLATGVIASVINTMCGMVGGGIIGGILFILIFVIGHALNMAINVLGAYVHTNRLQFVEFFGKFYEGGGKPFRPFSTADNKYFKFKEENSNG